MLSCRDAADLLGAPDAKKLPLMKKLSLRVHLMLCKLCRRHARQLKAIDRMARDYGRRIADNLNSSADALSMKAREEIRASLRE
jgi:hypothetical protein